MCTKFEIVTIKFGKVMNMYLKIIQIGPICSVRGVGTRLNMYIITIDTIMYYYVLLYLTYPPLTFSCGDLASAINVPV